MLGWAGLGVFQMGEFGLGEAGCVGLGGAGCVGLGGAGCVLLQEENAWTRAVSPLFCSPCFSLARFNLVFFSSTGV